MGLSSDILEAQFGPTELEVLKQNLFYRLSRTYTVATGQNLELSAVSFVAETVGLFPEVEKLMRGGMSMGKAFRSQSLPFERREQSVRRIEVTPELSKFFGIDGPCTVVLVTIVAGEVQYAHIFEVYSPAVYWEGARESRPTLVDEEKFKQLATDLAKVKTA